MVWDIIVGLALLVVVIIAASFHNWLALAGWILLLLCYIIVLFDYNWQGGL